MLGPQKYSPVGDAAFAPRPEWAQSQERHGGVWDRVAFADSVVGRGLWADRRERLLCSTACRLDRPRDRTLSRSEWACRHADLNRLRRGSALDRSSGRPDRKSSAGYGQGCDYMRRAGCGGVVEQRDVVFGCRPAGRAWIGRGANPDPIRISPGAPRDAWNSGRQRNQRSHGGRYASRPASSWIASMSNWRVVFLSSAATILVLAIALAVRLPPRTPESKSTYPELLASMGRLALKSRVLRQRVIYQCFLYAAFSVRWHSTSQRRRRRAGGRRLVRSLRQ